MEMSLSLLIILISTEFVHGVNDESKTNIVYESPVFKDKSIYLSEHFDDSANFNKVWIKSKGKKTQDGNPVSYEGIWNLEQALSNALADDYGLVLKSKAKHAAISTKLHKPFVFQSSPFIIQYEVTFQEGQECGGAYVKLLSEDAGLDDLTKFHDLSPYTIMFGPDKCGNDHMLHFIFRHKNPKSGKIEEKHCKKPNKRLDEYFTDQKPHLYTLILKPDNTFKILIDHNIVNEGSLLEDFTPEVNPPAEIDDPNDAKPADWDEREKIPDPTAKKPADWDENAPETIVDANAVKPDGWLDDEPVDIKDPVAEKPDDWDEDMDGEWEPPLVPNPLCQDAPGCGNWVPPQIPNPSYKGKWYPQLIDNPNYKGKWSPRKIANPDFFEDLHPFKMTSIGAVGFELWSMSANILFDNILITDNEDIAKDWAARTFDLKKKYFDKNEDSLFNRIVNYTNQYPVLWAVYIVLLLIPTVLAVLYCFGGSSKDKEVLDASAARKKTDEPEPDDEDENEVSKNEEDEKSQSSGDDKSPRHRVRAD